MSQLQKIYEYSKKTLSLDEILLNVCLFIPIDRLPAQNYVKIFCFVFQMKPLTDKYNFADFLHQRKRPSR